MYDVVVIGGGPIGSYTAYRMAVMGHKVVVLERKRKPGGKPCCTGIVGQECISAFNIDTNVILRRVNSARLYSPSGNQLRLWREEIQACVLDRAAFNLSMVHRAQGSGVEYIFDCPAINLEIKGDKITVLVSRLGTNTRIESGVAVIANGFGGNLCERSALGRSDDFTVGTQVEVETASIEEVEVYFGRERAPGFFAWLVPTSPCTGRVGLLSRKNTGEYFKKLLNSLTTEGKIVSTMTVPDFGRIPLKPLSRTYGERMIAVGDAAGQVKPTTGGGIYYGLLCADIAADTLHYALEDNDLSAKRLGSYERMWKKRLGRELRVGYWARKLFECISDRQLDQLFDIVEANHIDESLLKAKDLSFDWHGRVVLRLMGYQAVSRALNMIKIPFRTGRKD